MYIDKTVRGYDRQGQQTVGDVKEVEEVTFDEVALALFNVLDGSSWKDIQYHTGLPDEECQKIYGVFGKVSKMWERGELKEKVR